MKIKNNYHSKSVNYLTEQNTEVPDNFYLTIRLCGMLIIYKVCRQIRCMMNKKFKATLV